MNEDKRKGTENRKKRDKYTIFEKLEKGEAKSCDWWWRGGDDSCKREGRPAPRPAAIGPSKALESMSRREKFGRALRAAMPVAGFGRGAGGGKEAALRRTGWADDEEPG